MSVTYFKRYRMEIALRGRRFNIVRPPAGYRLRPWTPGLLADPADAKYHSFRQEIDATLFPCLGEMDGCRRLVEEISCKDGFLAEATWLVEYVGGGTSQVEACGTIQGIRASRRHGGIQNVGITPMHRGRGIGSCLIAATLTGFQQVGLQRAYLEVTVQNGRAIKLYQRMGFQPIKTLYKADELAYT